MMRLIKFTTKLLILGVLLISQPSFAMVETYISQNKSSENVVNPNNWYADFKANPEMKNLPPELTKLTLEEFTKLTPSKFEEMTGKKLSLIKKLKLKVAQKFIKKKAGTGDISKGLYIVLAIIGLGWLAMGLLDNWSGSDWIISLVLYFLFFIPGLIYTLIKMNKYY